MQISRRLSSSTLVKRVFGGGKSYATVAASSDAQPTMRRYKRIPKAERRVMVESYVNKYRAMNSGKFPTLFDTHKQVGGSYYVIKQLLQELEYQSRMPTMSRKGDKPQEMDISMASESAIDPEMSSTKMTVSENIIQDAQIRDRIPLVKEATSDNKSLPDLGQASSSQLGVDTEAHGNSQKAKKKVSRGQMTLDTQIRKSSGIQRETQASVQTEASDKSKSSSQSRMPTTSRRDDKLQEKDISKASESAINPMISSTRMTVSENIIQDAQTRDRISLVKEATSDNKSLPDLGRASSSQLGVDTETHDNSQKGKEKVSRGQMTLDTQIPKSSGIHRDTQAAQTEASIRSKSSSQTRMRTTSRRDDKLQEEDIESATNPKVCSSKMTVSEIIIQDAQTKDRTSLEKEATTENKSLPDRERASSSQQAVDAETHGRSQKGKKKVSKGKLALDTKMHKASGIQRETQAFVQAEASNRSKSCEAEEMIFSETQINEGIRENTQLTAINYVESDLLKPNDRTLLEEMPRSSTTAGTTEAMKAKISPIKEAAVGSHRSAKSAENDRKEEGVAGNMLEVDRLKSEAEKLRQADKSETHTRDLSKEHRDDTQPQRKSFMWENLKSLAKGIANIWRKL